MNKKDEQIKFLKQRLKDSEHARRDLDAQMVAMELDRDLYRDLCVEFFKWFVKLLSESKTPCLKYMTKRLLQVFNAGKKFHINISEE